MGGKYKKLKLNNWKYIQKYPTCIREGWGAVLALKPHSQMIIFVVSHRDKNLNPNQMFYSQHKLFFFPCSCCQSKQLKQNVKFHDVIVGSWELVKIYCRLPLIFSDISSAVKLCFLLTFFWVLFCYIPIKNNYKSEKMMSWG